MSYAHILGTMYELCSYYDNGFIIDELRYIISSMTFIMTPMKMMTKTTLVYQTLIQSQPNHQSKPLVIINIRVCCTISSDMISFDKICQNNFRGKRFLM